jgi:hypothetical protein
MTDEEFRLFRDFIRAQCGVTSAILEVHPGEANHAGCSSGTAFARSATTTMYLLYDSAPGGGAAG